MYGHFSSVKRLLNGEMRDWGCATMDFGRVPKKFGAMLCWDPQKEKIRFDNLAIF